MKIKIKLNTEKYKNCYLVTTYIKGNKDFKGFEDCMFAVYLYPQSWDKYPNAYKDGFVLYTSDVIDIKNYLLECENYIIKNNVYYE